MARIYHLFSALVLCLLYGSFCPALAVEGHAVANRYPVFIVTDRDVQHTDHGLVFGNGRSTSLAYGTAPVQAAEKRTPSEEVTLLDDQKQFFDKLKETGATHCAVFVHGYRKSFDGSLELAREMASQLDEPVILFAWPSKNKYSAYMIDECTAEWSSYHLADVLRDLGNSIGNQNVRVISHSLAARMVCWSYGILAQTNELRKP
ncbi:MAG: alpha/beta hydrolase, partial [Terriglobales bacterium]